MRGKHMIYLSNNLVKMIQGHEIHRIGWTLSGCENCRYLFATFTNGIIHFHMASICTLNLQCISKERLRD